MPDYYSTLENIRNQLHNLQSQFDHQILMNSYYIIHDLVRVFEQADCSHAHNPLLEELRQISTPPDIQEVHNIVSDIKREITAIGSQADSSPCHQAIENTLSHLSAILVHSFDPRKPSETLGSLDYINQQKAFQLLVEPLGNQKRIHIIFEIYNGKQRFKDLEEALNLSGGHLLYHLNPLKESQHVMQDEQKNYRLGPKGLHFLRQLKAQYDLFVKET